MNALMKMSTGIVLKHYAPKKNLICLLDQSLGRIKAVLRYDMLSAGTLLAYILDKYNNVYYIKDIELIDMPFAAAIHDVFFVHHLIEICYYFVQEGACIERVYAILSFVFSKNIFTNIQKKKILCVLYAALGLLIEQESLYNEYIYSLEQEPLHDMIDKDIDINIEKNISRWLYQSIRTHIDVRYIRTIHFLDEI